MELDNAAELDGAITSAPSPPRPRDRDETSAPTIRRAGRQGWHIGWLVVTGITVALAAWGLATLGHRTLWLDEAFTVVNSRTGVLDIARLNGGSMLGYYVLMKPLAWSTHSEVALRLPSLVAIVATIPCFHLLARRLLTPDAAVIATLALAANPWTVAYGREARPYAFVLLLSVLAWYAWIRAFDQPASSWRWAWALTTVTGCYMHLLFILIVPAQLLIGVARSGSIRGLARLAVPASLMVLLTVPLAFFALHPDAGNPAWIEPVSVAQVGAVLEQLVGLGFLPFGLLVLLSAALSGHFVAGAGRDASSPWRYMVPITWFVSAIGGLFVMSLMKPLFVMRYLLVALPALALMVGLGSTWITRRHRWAASAFAVVLVSSSLPHWHHQTVSEDWDWVSRRVVSAEDDVGIVVAMSRSRTAIDVYLEWNGLDVQAIAASPIDPWGEPRREYTTSSAWPDDMREVWLVFRPGPPARTAEVVRQIREAGFDGPHVEPAPDSPLAILRFTKSGGQTRASLG